VAAEKETPKPDQTAQQPAAPTHETDANAQPLPPRPHDAPVFDLSGTESESNALAFGDHVVPAMRDDRFRNQPPPYPLEAEINGEHGSVTIVIHVAENGTATAADVTESSGYDVLDQAALTAALKWHFHPAIKDGQAVPFDMPFRFIFEPD
jgi:protein TonB